MPENRQGKLVVAGGFLLLFSVMGIACNCFALSIVPITGYFGFSRASYALSQTLMFVFSSIFTLLSSKIYRKMDMVAGARIAALAVTLAFFLQSYATKVWMFYISYSIIGFGMAMCTAMPVSLLINEWVDVNASTLIGFAMMGSGLGGAVFNPIMNSLITSSGWQSAYRILAVVMGVMAIPAAFLMLKRNPLAPAGARKSGGEIKKTRSIPLLQKRILFMALILFLSNGASSALNFAINPQLQDLGYSAAFASVCSSVENAVMAAGKITVGRLLDRRGSRTALYMSVCSTLVSMTALAFFRSPLALFLVLINLGLFFGCPIGTVGGVAITGDIVGKENMPAFIGFLSFCMSLGPTFSPMLLGKTYDMFGSYSPLLLTLAAVMALTLPLIAVTYRAPLKKE